MYASKILVLAVFFAVVAPQLSHSQILNQVKLSDLPENGDNARTDLALFDANLYPDPKTNKLTESTTLAASYEFSFPSGANDGFYGIDVSHHNGSINWSDLLTGTKISFVYIKATQGRNFIDPKFRTNWVGVSVDPRIYRGAYHFLSAGIAGSDQADAYMSALMNVGALTPRGVFTSKQLRPVVDVEWDCPSKCVKPDDDRWKNVSRADRIKIIKDWIDRVRAFTHAEPIIYTSKTWWEYYIGEEDTIPGVQIWIVDQLPKKSSRRDPIALRNHPVKLWQFSSAAVVGDLNNLFDANKVYQSDISELVVPVK